MSCRFLLWTLALMELSNSWHKSGLQVHLIEPVSVNLSPIKLSTQFISDCIKIEGDTRNYFSFFYLFLTSEYYDPETLTSKALTDAMLIEGDNLPSKTLDLIQEPINVEFCGLRANMTYYLYSLQKSYDLRSQSPINVEIVHFTDVEVKTTSLSTILFAFIALLSGIISALCFYFLYRFKNTSAKTSLSDPHKYISTQDLELSLTAASRTWPPRRRNLLHFNKLLERKNQEFDDKYMCGICCDRPREVVFLNCGHIYVCTDCSKGLAVCPLDKQPIKAQYRYKICDKYGINNSCLADLTISSFKAHNCYNPALSYDKITDQLETSDKFKVLRERFDNYNYFEKCLKCDKGKKDTLFVDCCHLLYCKDCAEDVKQCPIDDVEITQKLSVFFA